VAYVPGMIATEIAAESIEKYGDALLADIPCRRFGTPEDLGKVLVFLASDAAGYMNDCHVEISGGKRCVQNPQFSYQ
jgi:NAD(P)-dependent dehydrogenase (short-subunit alcohol dehydrogenase family)